MHILCNVVAVMLAQAGLQMQLLALLRANLFLETYKCDARPPPPPLGVGAPAQSHMIAR